MQCLATRLLDLELVSADLSAAWSRDEYLGAERLATALIHCAERGHPPAVADRVKLGRLVGSHVGADVPAYVAALRNLRAIARDCGRRELAARSECAA